MDSVAAEALVADAFEQLGVEVHVPPTATSSPADLLVDPGGVGVWLEVKYRSLVNEAAAQRLLDVPLASGVLLFVVGDRVTEEARRILTSGHAGYLDLRGRLALRGPGLLVDSDVDTVKERPERSDALVGAAGLEVASALLMQPQRAVAVRELARELGRAPSTVSEVLAGLRHDGLVDKSNTVQGPDLFWRLAERWPTSRTYLAHAPDPNDAASKAPLRFGLDDVEHRQGWALTDSAAAVAYGAPLAFKAGQLLDFFVQDESVLRRASNLLGSAATVSTAQAAVRVAPVPAAVRQRVAHDALAWPLAHPLFVALDLAQDVGRGREILDAWKLDEGRWARVW